MTAGPSENQTAGQAQARGEAAAHAHETDARAQHALAGSSVGVEAASSPDAHSVSWSNADSAAQPTLNPSEPRPVGQYEIHGPPDAA